MRPINSNAPDYAIHPGEILEEHLEARGIRKADLAKRAGLTDKTISLIINGKAPIMPDLAIQLERILGVSSKVWNNLNSNYYLWLADKADKERLKGNINWAKCFPLSDLFERGCFPQRTNLEDTVNDLLSFFKVGSVESWEKKYEALTVSYRKSPAFKSDKKSVACWLRICELQAENIQTRPYDRSTFREALAEIRLLTKEDPKFFDPRMKELCRESGVALVFEPELPKIRLSGATRWLNPKKALVMLSLRYKMDDHFWFTFFHEAGHILLHGKKGIFIDEQKMVSNEMEEEANNFSSHILIPERDYRGFLRKRDFSLTSISCFANYLSISDGVVVGRLQHDGVIPFNRGNTLKRNFVFS